MRVKDNPRIPESAKVYRTAKSGRVYWAKRDSRGKFVSWDGSQGSPEYVAYFEARCNDAEWSCRGHVVNEEGRDNWARLDDMLRPGASRRYASPELCEWIRDNGETLSIREFHRQMRHS